MFTLAIIGTAGRDGKMYASLWLEVLHYLQNYINNIKNNIPLTTTLTTEQQFITLVSGGAAWIDHLAVILYLNQFNDIKLKLILNLPCHWDFDKHQFVDNGSNDWRLNPGKTSNHYHNLFSQKLGVNTLMQLEQAIQTADVRVYNGFHARNNEIAVATVLLAFTWVTGDQPADGGTAHTWRQCRGEKYHISLTKFVV